MIDLKECIKFCIENFTAEEATERIHDYINESLYLKEQEIELKYSLSKLNENVKGCQKEITIDYLKDTIKAIYECEYESCEGIWKIFVDPNVLNKEQKEILDKFAFNNNRYRFIFQTCSYNCNTHY